MVTNTPVGVLGAIVIFPSCLDFTVVHRLLRQTSICRDHARKEICDRRLSLDDEQTGRNRTTSGLPTFKHPPAA